MCHRQCAVCCFQKTVTDYTSPKNLECSAKNAMYYIIFALTVVHCYLERIAKKVCTTRGKSENKIQEKYFSLNLIFRFTALNTIFSVIYINIAYSHQYIFFTFTLSKLNKCSRLIFRICLFL